MVNHQNDETGQRHVRGEDGKGGPDIVNEDGLHVEVDQARQHVALYNDELSFNGDKNKGETSKKKASWLRLTARTREGM